MAADGDLDWDDLRYFLGATQSGTLSGAARSMGVDHSTIGRRLSSLERAIGAPLVIRDPAGLRLTPLGERLVPLAEEVERAVLAFHGQATQRQARVRLATPTGFTRLFSASLPRLRADYPQLTLELLTGASPVDIHRGEADMAIRSGSIIDQDLIARPLGECGWSLYASSAYLARHPGAIDLDDLSGQEIIGYDSALSRMPAARWIEQRLQGATVTLRGREMTDMLAAALSGAGLALIPCFMGDDEPDLARVTPSVLASHPLALVYPREARLSQPAQAVIRFVVGVMGENAARIEAPAAPDEPVARVQVP